jgi:hypothetical protein
MIFPANQIVGLIEIETPTGADAGSLVALGREELSVGELLAWLTGTMARPPVDDDVASLPSAAGPVNRFAGLADIQPTPLLAADLGQLETDLAAATAQFRLRLSAISAGE